MPILDWDDSMSVGVEPLDRQHHVLIDLLNEAYDVLMDGHLPDEEQRFLEGMARYAEEHFALEESYMAKAGFRGLEAHRREHEWFRQQLALMSGDEAAQNRMLDVFTFLSKWFKSHFLEKDQEYVAAVGGRSAKR